MAEERAAVVCQSHLQLQFGFYRNERRECAELIVIVDAMCAVVDFGGMLSAPNEPDDIPLQAKEPYCWGDVCCGPTGRLRQDEDVSQED
jgi:hypothetical protein